MDLVISDIHADISEQYNYTNNICQFQKMAKISQLLNLVDLVEMNSSKTSFRENGSLAKDHLVVSAMEIMINILYGREISASSLENINIHHYLT